MWPTQRLVQILFHALIHTIEFFHLIRFAYFPVLSVHIPDGLLGRQFVTKPQ